MIGGMNIGVAIPNPRIGRAERLTTNPTIAVASSAGTDNFRLMDQDVKRD